VRNGITDLFAALNLATGEVIHQLRPRHRAAEFKKFLTAIDKAVPAGLDVHVVLDNSSTHKTADINKWLVRHPRFHFHFTPTSSSWLDLVERWFAELSSMSSSTVSPTEDATRREAIEVEPSRGRLPTIRLNDTADLAADLTRRTTTDTVRRCLS